LKGRQIEIVPKNLGFPTLARQKPKSYLTPFNPFQDVVLSPSAAHCHSGFGALRMARQNSSPIK
jgi:hypothetical protein